MKENHHLYQRHGVWWIRFARRGRSVRLSTKAREIEAARKVRDEILGLEVSSEHARRILSRQETPQGPPEDAVIAAIARSMWKRARSRAKAHGRRFLLTEVDVRTLLAKSGWKCAVSGIPFEVGRDFPRSTGPFKPSLDRIDSKKPYALVNVRVVCCIANLAMNEWGLDVLRRLAAGVTGHTTGHSD